MKGLVWGFTFEAGKEKLREIKSRYEMMGIFVIKEVETKYEFYLIFSNGDNWRCVRASENSRGCKANISYVDRRIDPMFVDVVIRHCTCAPPYNAIAYYGEPLEWPKEDDEIATNFK